jgi:hypothetical protein
MFKNKYREVNGASTHYHAVLGANSVVYIVVGREHDFDRMIKVELLPERGIRGKGNVGVSDAGLILNLIIEDRVSSGLGVKS